MLFYSFFKTLIGKDVIVELKNDMALAGKLHSLDQYMNIKLSEIQLIDPERFPHFQSVRHSYIRGSSVRMIQLPAKEIDTRLLEEATRKHEIENQNE
ncbi:hypothetical protein SNEBB_009725 [Seison nebaliae]|nr:hypothetical protein SNEBB_009725 [Seison nebaliae]